ncbi:MAG: hypothetical protein ACOH2E_04815 [Candidatus Paracaedibacter sp.]
MSFSFELIIKLFLGTNIHINPGFQGSKDGLFRSFVKHFKQRSDLSANQLQPYLNATFPTEYITAITESITLPRPKVITPETLEKIKSFKKSDEFSVTTICKMLQISRTTYYRVITLIDNDQAI